MKRINALSILLLAIPMAGESQVFGPPDSTFARDYRVDMAIPEMPAFKLLDVSSGTILRPGIPSELNTIVSSFFNDGNIRLPKSLAIETSPALLISGSRLNRATYKQQKLLHALRFSAAVRQGDEEVGRDIAFGLRLGLVNEADLRLDDSFADEDTTLLITPLLRRINDIHSRALERLGPPGQRVGPPIYSKAERDEIDELSAMIRQRWAARHWNARAIDVAIGVRANSLDDQGRDTRVDGLAAWATYADGFGDWGQLLVGAHAGAQRTRDDDAYVQSLGFGVRLYVGTNLIKGFVEVQNELQEDSRSDLFANSGAEVRLFDWIWAAGSLGFARDPDGGTTTRTSLKFNTSFPRL
jgi:hypothetical protein